MPLQTIYNRLKQYKFIVIPSIPLILFTLFLLLLPFLQPAPPEDLPQKMSNPTPIIIQPGPFSREAPEDTIVEREAGEYENPESVPGLKEKTQLPDGSTKYTYTSSNPSRENLVIIGKGDEFIFERTLTRPEYPVTINDYTDSYGQPEQVIQGPSVFGSQVQTYIYASLGVSFVGDPQTNLVLEEHLYEPITVSEYINRFGQYNK